MDSGYIIIGALFAFILVMKVLVSIKEKQPSKQKCYEGNKKLNYRNGMEIEDIIFVNNIFS